MSGFGEVEITRIYSVKPHVLVDKIAILKGQISVLSSLLLSDKMKQEIKTKRKSQEPQSTAQKDETKEEISQLTAEKNRLESYLKVKFQKSIFRFIHKE